MNETKLLLQRVIDSAYMQGMITDSEADTLESVFIDDEVED